MNAEQRRAWCKNHLRSADVFRAGLFMMAALLLNPSTELRGVQFLLFWLYAWLCGKKNNALITLSVMLGIVAFNLLSPFGKVLVEWGVFHITEGALLSGLRKAFTLEGLLMLSKASIRPDLRLPGAFGSLLADTFRVFERIAERRDVRATRRPRAARFHWVMPLIERTDALLLELSAEEDARSAPCQTPPETPPETPRTVTTALVPLVAALLPLALTVYAWRA
ncbi:MAG: hypothetical protein LBS86_04970 [Treponema sp.]|jgi:heptaprenyl diphosphate synthase|nr:hypothetical protein [Treponema sp.]